MNSIKSRAAIASIFLAAASGCSSAGATDEIGETGETSQAASTAHVLEFPPFEATQVDTYYVTFFSYQQGVNLLISARENSHTFAQYVHARPDGFGGISISDQDKVTVSWMPLSGVVRAFGPPETGEATELDFEMQRGANINRSRGFAWGPFRVPAEVFERAERQRALLATGSVLYKATGRDPVSRDTNYLLSNLGSKPDFLNCVAAVGDVAPNGGVDVGVASGRTGTQIVVDHYSAFIIDRPVNDGFHDRHRWLSTRLNHSRFNALFTNGLELQEQPGHNSSGPVPPPPPAQTFSTCFCQGQPALLGAVNCSFFGVRPGQSGPINALQTVRTRAYNNASECATHCSTDWPAHSAACATVNNSGHP